MFTPWSFGREEGAGAPALANPSPADALRGSGAAPSGALLTAVRVDEEVVVLRARTACGSCVEARRQTIGTGLRAPVFGAVLADAVPLEWPAA